MGVPVFFLERTDRYRVALRRYTPHNRTAEGPCSYHQAMTPIGAHRVGDENEPDTAPPRDDPRWPTKCEGCDHVFTDEDVFQLFTDRIYRRVDTREEMTLREAPVGACWNASWHAEYRAGPDGRCLVVRCPDGHDWMVDSRASNCTLPDDNAHRCWVRHGRPEDGTLHVDKNGQTCAAGAGSIQTSQWHGFLHNGQLVEC